MKIKIGLIFTMLALFLAACGSTAAPEEGAMEMDDEMAMEDGGSMEMDGDGMMMEMDSGITDATADGFAVMDVWGRAAPEVQPTGAFYMMINNGTDTDEVLQSATIEGVCGTIELHEMVFEGDIMRMQEVDGGEIMIPAGKAVQLKPGGLHVMCLEKSGELMPGAVVPITLNFANAGAMEFEAEIREVDGGMNMHGGDGEMEHGDMDMEDGEMEMDSDG